MLIVQLLHTHFKREAEVKNKIFSTGQQNILQIIKSRVRLFFCMQKVRILMPFALCVRGNRLK
jgi:hypothetical protein